MLYSELRLTRLTEILTEFDSSLADQCSKQTLPNAAGLTFEGAPFNESNSPAVSQNRSAVPNWKKASPKHNSYRCNFYLHLRRYGLSLAIYDLIGTVTNGGENDFYGKISRLSEYFESNPEATRRAFKRLVNDGWLEALPKKSHYKFIKHDIRAFSKSDCATREVAHWSADADPFVGKLHAAASGQLRVQAHWVPAARKNATDEEFLFAFKRRLQKGGPPGTCFWDTVREFRRTKVPAA